MGILDRLTTAPPRRDALAPDEDVSHGEQASAYYGEHLHEAERVMQAQATADEGRSHYDAELLHEPHAPVLAAAPTVANDFFAETYIIEAGAVVQLLARDPSRRNVDITNQTGAENAAGAGIAVFLFRSERAARAFANATNTQTTGRFAILPDGAGRELKHTAPMYAAVRPGVASYAVVDVITTSLHAGHQ